MILRTVMRCFGREKDDMEKETTRRQFRTPDVSKTTWIRPMEDNPGYHIYTREMDGLFKDEQKEDDTKRIAVTVELDMLLKKKSVHIEKVRTHSSSSSCNSIQSTRTATDPLPPPPVPPRSPDTTTTDESSVFDDNIESTFLRPCINNVYSEITELDYLPMV